MDIAAGDSQPNSWTAPENGVIKNIKSLTFPVKDGNIPVTVTHFGLYDAKTGGNLLMYGPINPKTLENQDTISVGVNGITITFE